VQPLAEQAAATVEDPCVAELREVECTKHGGAPADQQNPDESSPSPSCRKGPRSITESTATAVRCARKAKAHRGIPRLYAAGANERRGEEIVRRQRGTQLAVR